MNKTGQLGLLSGFDQVISATTKEQEYAEYMRSPAWRKLRKQALELAGKRCQKCGVSQWSAKLEVHHLTYDRFKRERLNDLVVLCAKCHLQADAKRRIDVKRKNAQALEDARLDGWASKVYGENWSERDDYDEIVDRFEQWRERKDY